jgi:hypothetical protein
MCFTTALYNYIYSYKNRGILGWWHCSLGLTCFSRELWIAVPSDATRRVFSSPPIAYSIHIPLVPQRFLKQGAGSEKGSSSIERWNRPGQCAAFVRLWELGQKAFRRPPSHWPLASPCQAMTRAMLFTITSETTTMHDDWMGQHHRTLYSNTLCENLVHRFIFLWLPSPSAFRAQPLTRH